MLNYFLNGSKAYKRIIIIVGFKMFLNISFSVVKDIEHFSFFIIKVVSIYLKFLLYLKLLALKSRINSIR